MTCTEEFILKFNNKIMRTKRTDAPRQLRALIYQLIYQMKIKNVSKQSADVKK